MILCPEQVLLTETLAKIAKTDFQTIAVGCGFIGVRKVAPEKNCPPPPRSGSGFGLGLALELGLGAIFLEPALSYLLIDLVKIVLVPRYVDFDIARVKCLSDQKSNRT